MTDDREIEIATDGTKLPVEQILTGRGFATGKSGAGKSNSVGVLVEGLLDRGHAVLIVDTDGEYYGLKERYEVLHASGDEEGDIKVGPEHAEKLAGLALNENIPVVLDVSGFVDEDVASDLVENVARQLFAKAKKARKPFLLVVEELHEYLPQSGSAGDVGDMLTTVAKRGRKHGLGLLGISQRPAAVSKDFITQCNWLTWHRLTWENDVRVVRNIYGSEIADQISDLDDGEAFLVADFRDEIERVQWLRKKTFDAGDTPGLDETERPELRSIDESLVESLQEAGESARTKDDRIEDLEERVDDLLDDLESKEAEIERLEERNAFEEQIASRFDDALGDSFDLEFTEGNIRADVLEVVQEKQDLEENVDELQAERDELREQVDELESELSDVRDERDELREQVDDMGEADQLLEDLRELVGDRYPSLFHVETDEQVERLRSEIETLRGRNDDLEAELETVRSGRPPAPEPEDFDDVVELLQTDVVRGVVEEAEIEAASTKVWSTLIALARVPDPPVEAGEILGSVPFESTKSIHRVLRALEGDGREPGIVSSTKQGRRKLYRIDRDGIDRVIEKKREDEQIAEIAERVAGSGGEP